MAMADNPLKAARRLEPGMAGEKSGNLDLDRLGKQGTRPVAQNFGELSFEGPWLDQFEPGSLRPERPTARLPSEVWLNLDTVMRYEGLIRRKLDGRWCAG